LRDAEIDDGYLHFYPTITEDYFEELTAEKEIRKYKAGRIHDRVWTLKSGRRNEAWDELIYAYSCLLRLYQVFPIYKRRLMWDKYAKYLLNNDSKTAKKAVSSRQAANKRSYINSW
jgi:phage terminase large subunit GpA-like protein